MRHLARKEEIINKQKIWSKNTEEKRPFRKISVREVLKKQKLGCGLNSAGFLYGPTVKAAMNPLKGGQFLDRLACCKLLKMHFPVRNQNLTLQYGLGLFLSGKPKILLRVTDTEYFVYPAVFFFSLNVVKTFLRNKRPACSISVKFGFRVRFLSNTQHMITPEKA